VFFNGENTASLPLFHTAATDIFIHIWAFKIIQLGQNLGVTRCEAMFYKMECTTTKKKSRALIIVTVS
jgi:hypothetical protein